MKAAKATKTGTCVNLRSGGLNGGLGDASRKAGRPSAILGSRRLDARIAVGPAGNKDRTESMSEDRPPLPPFTLDSAIQKVRAAEDAWNSCNPERVSLAYSVDSHWRNRSEFLDGRAEIVAFLTRKWNRELDYRLIKELWAFTGNRIAVRFAYEYHDDSGHWFRAYGNENWEFDAHVAPPFRLDQRPADRRPGPAVQMGSPRCAATRPSKPRRFRPVRVPQPPHPG